MDPAVTFGHLALVQSLHGTRAEGRTTDARNGAAAHGNFEVVRWRDNNRTEACTDQALLVAAIQGHLDIAR
ncbi:hypothetical protein JG688_00012505 [Phytophthora aleatoria]|uniref:Uncharacterized protein n=1 Tax=Phytophthora aleatoria TaxID=2496075 RepID=A0A8J5IJ30_9STRA|nr:hypothetical protein JG688_00012505 [Phytophthora aleatoria]